LKRLRSSAFLAVAVLALAVPSTATAAPVIPGAQPFDVFFVDDHRVCSFDVKLSIVDGTNLHKDTSPVFSTGPLVVTATNIDTGRAKTYNISGPTFRNGTLTGPALIIQPADAGLGDPFLIVNDGRVIFNTNFSIKTSTGHRTNICTDIA
jgi:hypothetical protein